MKKRNLAPVILFVYNRPWHVKKTVEALKRNFLAQESELFIFSDGEKRKQDREVIKQVRGYVKKITGFASVEVVEREKNYGLAKNIIEGVTSIIKKYGKLIVLEDDLLTSKYFLKFMNDALELYADEKKIWHISGWNYEIDPKEFPKTFLWRVMNCWGWATWADRWQCYERNPQDIIGKYSKKDIKRFNLDGANDFWEQIKGNVDGRIDTWAIFWYEVIFRNAGLCLNPTRSLVKNIGHDGSGTHCGKFGINGEEMVEYKISMNRIYELEENKLVVEKIKKNMGNKYLNGIKKLFYAN
jgi:hypothetical protein